MVESLEIEDELGPDRGLHSKHLRMLGKSMSQLVFGVIILYIPAGSDSAERHPNEAMLRPWGPTTCLGHLSTAGLPIRT